MVTSPRENFNNVFRRKFFITTKNSLLRIYFLLLFFTEYSGALPGLPTSYAALIRIKKSSSSSLYGSKTRPRYSNPSLGTLSVSSPSWRGASAQHYYSPINLYHSSDAFKQDGKCQRKIAPVGVKQARKSLLEITVIEIKPIAIEEKD